MDSSSEDERTIPVPNHSTTIISRDNRRPFERQLAVHLILASLLFERTAFNSLVDNLSNTLQFNETGNWTSTYVSAAPLTFTGNENIN